MAGTSEAPPLVKIDKLSKSYRRGDQTIPVLTDIFMEVAFGEFLALMGPSGSGQDDPSQPDRRDRPAGRRNALYWRRGHCPTK